MLIANAGVMIPPVDQLTAQKFDLQFGINVLGHLLFIRLLYPLLVSTTTPADPSRIVWVASSMQYYFQPPIKYEWTTDTEARRKQDPWYLYIQSKFATVQLVHSLQRELGDKDGVVVLSLDPGNIKSDLQRHNQSFIVGVLVSPMVGDAFLSLTSVVSSVCCYILSSLVLSLSSTQLLIPLPYNTKGGTSVLGHDPENPTREPKT